MFTTKSRIILDFKVPEYPGIIPISKNPGTKNHRIFIFKKFSGF